MKVPPDKAHGQCWVAVKDAGDADERREFTKREEQRRALPKAIGRADGDDAGDLLTKAASCDAVADEAAHRVTHKEELGVP